MWLKNFGQQEVTTTCSQFVSVPTVTGLGLSIFCDYPDDGQPFSGWVMVKKHCTATECRHRSCQMTKILDSKTA
jgi:hypothetical protein